MSPRKRDLMDRAATTDQERADQATIEAQGHDQALEDLATVVSTDPGRRFVWWLLKDICGVGLPTRSPVELWDGRVEVHATMLRIGTQDVGHQVIRQLILAAPGEYRKMLADEATLAHSKRMSEAREAKPKESDDDED